MRVSLASRCIFLLTALLLLPEPIYAKCGKERWSVKTGTDADAGLVSAAVVSTTVSRLRAIAKPASLPSTRRIAPTETTLFEVEGVLTAYKREPDQDYHLVIKDNNRTVIVELADPQCVGAGSPFRADIRQARNDFDARFTATGSYKTTNTRVCVQGVGFFDRVHGQRGVAPNGIELHPVTAISFGACDGAQPLVAGAAPAEVLVNGGFEDTINSGFSAPGWTASSSTGHNVIIRSGSHPRTGENYAIFGERNNTEDTLEQTLTLPGDADELSLYFWYSVDTRETGTEPFDVVTISIRLQDGTEEELFAIDNRDARETGNDRDRFTEAGPIDLTSFKGGTVTLIFRGTTDESLVTSFRVDDLRVEVVKEGGS